MNVLFVYPDMPSGMRVHSKNMIFAIRKYFSDIDIFEKEYSEYPSETEYDTENHTLLDFVIKNKINLVHLEFDYGYFGVNFGCIPLLNLINLLKSKSVAYTVSVHNDPKVFKKLMAVLNKDTSKFNKIIEYITTESEKRKITHNPLYPRNFAPLLPAKEINYTDKNIDYKNKKQIILGIVGFLHKAKTYEDLFEFSKKNKELFIDKNIVIKARFFLRKDRQTPYRREYKNNIEKYNDSHICIEIVDENIDSYNQFFNEIDVGISTHCTLTERATITDYIYHGLPVIAKEYFYLLYLDFILMYNNWDALYNYISNIREILAKYDFNKQKSYCNMFTFECVAMQYRLSFIRNAINHFPFRKVVGALCYYNGELILFKKQRIPFYDIIHGGIEENETDEGALTREIYEELRLNSNQIIIKEKICSFEYSKPLKLQILVANKGSKMNVYVVELKSLPKLPSLEIENYSNYSADLVIYESTKQLLNNLKKP